MNPEPQPLLTRREAVRRIGAGAALVGLGALPFKSFGASDSPETPQPFVLPPLGYAYGALEPHIDARTMEIHHSKHHATYIANANKALSDHPELRSMTGEEILRRLDTIPEPLRTTLRNNVGGHVNHSFFWTTLSPGGGGKPSGTLADAIAQAFGSFAAFQAQLGDAGLKRFGSGWAWLSLKKGTLTIHSTANQDSPLSEGAVPIVGIDVWEHAYYLKHQNVRADYISDFWNVVDWTRAGERYAAAGRS